MERGSWERVSCVTSRHSKCCLEHCCFLFTTELQGQVCEQHVCAHFHVAYVKVCKKTPKKTEVCAIAGSQTPHHCTMLPPSSSLWRAMSGLWEFHCAESTGGEQSLHCAACSFGCLHAAFQRGAPSAFGSESLVDQAFAFWSLTRCAHSACCSSGLWGLPIIPQ